MMQTLKDKGIRVTSQRCEVYSFLCRENTHLTAEEIYEKIKTKLPAMSLATVYSILELFQEKGLVKEIRIDFGKSCFEGRTDIHHHFFCNKCKTIIDIDMPLCSSLEKREVNGHKIESVQGYFYGICKNCQNK